MRKPSRTLITALLFTTLLSSCSKAEPEAEHLNRELIGQTLSDSRFYGKNYSFGTIVDLSSQIGMEPGFRGGVDMNSVRWTIAAVCSPHKTLTDDESLIVAVIPTAEVSPDIVDRLNADAFAQYLMCDDVAD